MKRLIAIVISALIFAVSVTAQNANRKGFFAEIGVGASVGNMPVHEVVQNNVFKSGGAALNGAVGYRIATSVKCAFDAKLLVGTTTKGSSTTLVVGPLVGFRYFFYEFAGNKSLFVGGNIGTVYNDNFGSFGGAYQLLAGVNITNHLYGALAYDGYIFCHSLDLGNYHFRSSSCWGSIGLKIGYRF
ncbi:MAG: hypothetical protein K2M19_05440 [Muribaculaceae bacterium]|nr:hypothetical protein [Muribaculaceae bacterium]